MATHIQCRIGVYGARIAAEAAAWARAFYPDLEIAVHGDVVLLAAPDRTEAELRLIWSAALFNETQLKTQADGRNAMLEALSQ